jgi:DNA-entry nuclease
MFYFIEKLLFHYGIDSLHLSIGNIIFIFLGILLVGYVAKKTKKVRYTIIALAIIVSAISFFMAQYQSTLPTVLPEWTAPQVVVPICAVIIVAMLFVGIIHKGSKLALSFVISIMLMSLLSGGYIFSYFNPTSLGNFAQYIPFIPQAEELLNKGTNTVANNAQNVISSINLNGETQQTSGINYGLISDKKPNVSLAQSIMTENVKQQLGGSVSFVSADDYYIVGNGKAKLSVKNGSIYAHNTKINPQHQGGIADALLQRASYQGVDRNTTGNGEGDFRPFGYKQMKLNGSPYGYLFNLGHLLGYALIGNIHGFDASERNPNNILTQTAWANQANGGAQGKGQNYWEGVVRDEIKNTQAYVRYTVKPIYNNPKDIIPAGNQIEAISTDGKINFNVFVPNVEPAVEIDYATGNAVIK